LLLGKLAMSGLNAGESRAIHSRIGDATLPPLAVLLVSDQITLEHTLMTTIIDDEQADGAKAQQNTDAVFSQVYDRLRLLASKQVNRGKQNTLNATALVHELYMRMAEQTDLPRDYHTSFFAYAARAMRNILTDRARHRVAQKSGGDWLRITLTGQIEEDEFAVDVLALDEAIEQLQKEDERAAQVVQLRYFAGLTLEQVADSMKLNRRTITRDWEFARAYLRDKLNR
jgi:RNA polymerase sigma factor (TIGR02999 family)